MLIFLPNRPNGLAESRMVCVGNGHPSPEAGAEADVGSSVEIGDGNDDGFVKPPAC